jgi:hypothetical protein
MRWIRLSEVAFSLVALAACASPAPELATDDAEVVSEQTFQIARGVVQSVDYLPLDFPADGCYARALYYSMELATRKIESNAIYMIPALSGPYPKLGTTSWGYHVAPVIEVARSSAPPVAWVVDPEVSRAPLTIERWISSLAVTPEQVDIILLKGAAFNERMNAMKLAELPGGTYSEKLTASFDDMAPFDADAIQTACNELHKFTYYGARHIEFMSDAPPPISDAEGLALARPRRAKLIKRTRELVDDLSRNGRIAGTRAFSETECAASVDPREGTGWNGH